MIMEEVHTWNVNNGHESYQITWSLKRGINILKR